MKTIIYTSFPCLVKLDEKQENLTKNENLIIDEDFEKLLIYPTERGRISFEVDINEKENNFYRIIERGGKRLIFLLDGLYAENCEICEFEYNGIKSKIEIYQRKVIFSGRESKKIIHLNKKYRDFKYGNFKYIDYCLLNNYDNNCTLIAYNSQKNTAKVFNAKEILIDENGFSLIDSAFGYSSISQILYVDEEGLKVRKKDFISSSLSTPTETLSYQFLNSVKIGDFDKALSMLSPNLNNRLNKDSLKAYFGNISYFYMLNPQSAYAISNDKNVVYEFQIENNKIRDISSE